MTVNTTFDYLDTFYLANSFTLPQLRNEIEHAQYRAKITDIFQGTPYADLIGGKAYPELDWASFYSFPYEDYIQTCSEAIKAKLEHNKTYPLPVLPGKRINIEDIKARNDIYSVIEGYTKLSQPKGNRATGKCPMHESKGNPLTIYLDEQSWYCFHCNKGGDVFDFIMAVNSCDFKQAAAILGGT